MENFMCLSMLKCLEEICCITLFYDLFPFSQPSLTAESCLKVWNWISGCCKQAEHCSDLLTDCSEGETSYLSWGVTFPVTRKTHWLICFKLVILFPGWWDLFVHWELLPPYIEANELTASIPAYTAMCCISKEPASGYSPDPLSLHWNKY